MLGLIFALLQLAFVLIWAFLKITGLWFSAIVLIIMIVINDYWFAIPDPVAYPIIVVSLVISGIFFLKNLFNIVCNIIYYIKGLFS